jgi:hypothetical protein
MDLGMENFWAKEGLLEAGGRHCLPRSNWATYRDGGENLERLLGFGFEKACGNLQTNYQAKKPSNCCNGQQRADLERAKGYSVAQTNIQLLKDKKQPTSFYAKQEQTPKHSTAQNYPNHSK